MTVWAYEELWRHLLPLLLEREADIGYNFTRMAMAIVEKDFSKSLKPNDQTIYEFNLNLLI